MTKENSTESTEIQKYEIDKRYQLQQQKFESAALVKVGNENLASISMLAEKFSKAGDMIPKEFQSNPEKCFVAIYKGASLGIDAFTSLQRIAVINGRATIWGDTALALVRKSGLMTKFEETIVEKEGKMIARCVVQRAGEKEHISEYTQEEAVTAGLWGNNVWKKYPKRMLKYRARAFALRDIFADVLDGLYFKEEIEGDDDFNGEPKNITPPTANESWRKLGKTAWGKDDVRNDFGDVPAKEKLPIEPIKNYEELLDIMMLCDSAEALEEFEKEFKRDISSLSEEDQKKLSAMKEAQKIEFNNSK